MFAERKRLANLEIKTLSLQFANLRTDLQHALSTTVSNLTGPRLNFRPRSAETNALSLDQLAGKKILENALYEKT